MNRAIELPIVLFLFLALSPLIIFLLLMIKITSAGSPVYKQIRIGKNKKPFFIYKLRSMRIGADNISLLLHRKEMVTPLGKMLRKTNLDESLQLWNVIKGEMALVGPRPLPEEFVSMFPEEMSQKVFALRPGVFGLTPLISLSYFGLDSSSNRSASKLKAFIRAYSLLEEYYLFRRSPRLDKLIIVLTISTLIRKLICLRIAFCFRNKIATGNVLVKSVYQVLEGIPSCYLLTCLIF